MSGALKFKQCVGDENPKIIKQSKQSHFFLGSKTRFINWRSENTDMSFDTRSVSGRHTEAEREPINDQSEPVSSSRLKSPTVKPVTNRINVWNGDPTHWVMKCRSVACIWSGTPPSHRVTATAVLDHPPTLYTGGSDGSLIWWNLHSTDSNSVISLALTTSMLSASLLN